MSLPAAPRATVAEVTTRYHRDRGFAERSRMAQFGCMFLDIASAVFPRTHMSFIEISRDEFDSLAVERLLPFPERAWFKSTELDLAGTVIRDPIDKDWSYVLLAKDQDGIYRYIDGEVSLPTQQDAESNLF